MIRRVISLIPRMSTQSVIPETGNVAASVTTSVPTDTVIPPPSENRISPSTTVSAEFNTVTEGKATILTPKADEVFYNPIQQFNRDLSIMAIKAYDQLRHESFESSNKNKNKKRN